ncbi:MAG TPA: transcription termination factor NusA [bacterium]|nr:transcription termination factor NusA [bacterium]HPS30092.1 transcription termination factor NusA [bacterium]
MDFNLKELVDQLVKMKGIKRELIVDILKEALYRAVQKKLGTDADIDIMFDDATGELQAFYFREVVKDVSDSQLDISLEEALKLNPEAVVGDTLGIKMEADELGRIAAQVAKQVIIQKIKTLEGDIVFNEFKDRQNEIITGTVRRFEKGGIIVDIGKTEAYLPYSQHIPSDRFRINDRIKAFITDVVKTQQGCNILLSRINTMFLIKLFELEVPEIAEGIVKIEGVARDPGHRSKISVRSIDSDVDPVGACVGMKGSRIQNVVHELSGEKIDIIPWDEDSVKYICNTLSPVEVSQIIIDEEEHSMDVIVPDDQLSVAIGRGGENVRLASQLTGWSIDIQSESQMGMMLEEAKRRLLFIDGIDESIADSLIKLGYTTLEDLTTVEPEVLSELPDITTEKAIIIIEQAKKMLEKGMGIIDIDNDLEEKLNVPTTTLRCINEELSDYIAEKGYHTLADIQSEPDTETFAKNSELSLRRARQIRYSLQLHIDDLNGKTKGNKNNKINADAFFDFSKLDDNGDDEQS